MAIISGGKIIEGARIRPSAGVNSSTGVSNSPPNIFTNAGAPVANTTYVGVAALSDLLVDTTNAKLYICTATNGSTTITWTVVGTQT